MGYAGIMKDMIDDHYDGLSTGRNYYYSTPINTKLRYSEHEKRYFERYKLFNVDKVSEIQNTVKVIESTPMVQEDRLVTKQILIKWKYTLEYRKNILLFLVNKMSSSWSKTSINASYSETEVAYSAVEEILKKYMDIYITNQENISYDENEYMVIIAQQLIDRLLHVLEEVKESHIIFEIITDLKYLVAIVLHRKKNKMFCCSENEYISYLEQKIGKFHDDECECGNEIKFDRYRFCLACGKEYR